MPGSLSLPKDIPAGSRLHFPFWSQWILAALSVPLVGCGGGSQEQTVRHLVVSVTISLTSASVQTLATEQFNASVTGATNTAVTWQVNGINNGNATVGSITTDGLYTAPTVVPNPASFSITAIANADSTKKASAMVTITARTQVQIVNVQDQCSLPPALSSYNIAISSTGRYVIVEGYSVQDFQDTSNNYCLRDTCTGGPNSCQPQSLYLGGASSAAPSFIESFSISSMSADACYYGESSFVEEALQITSAEATLGSTGLPGCLLRAHLDSVAGNFLPPSVSATGRFYAFTDKSTLFVRDSCVGAGSGCLPANVWTAPYGGVGNLVIASEGRYVAFESWVSTIVPNDSNGVGDIFLVDTCVGAATGCVSQVSRVSVSSDGVQANGPSSLGAVTPDGRYVAFASSATNLVPDDSNAADDIFVRDTCIGAPARCSPSTYRVSVASDGSQSTGPSGFTTTSPSISADGRYVAFASGATNLVPSDTNGFADIFVRDTCAGAPNCTPSTMRVSLAQ